MSCCGATKELSLDDDCKLSPFQKWRRFGIFPCKLLLHVLLVLSGTYLVLLHNEVHGVTHRTLGQDFGRAFFPDSYQQYNGDAADNPQSRYFLFTTTDVNASINLMMQRYWALPQISLSPAEVAVQGPPPSPVDPSYDPNALPLPAAIYTHFTRPAAVLRDPSTHFAPNTKTDTVYMLGPWDVFPGAALLNGTATDKDFFSSLYTIAYDLRFRMHDPLPDDSPFNARACYEWQAVFTYDFHARHHFEITWAFNALRRCPGDTTVNAWVATMTLATLFFAFAHELATLWATFRWMRLFLRALKNSEDGGEGGGAYAALSGSEVGGAAGSGGGGKGAGKAKSKNNNSGSSSRTTPLRLRDMLSLLRPWLVLSTFGALLVAAHAMILLAADFDVSAGRGQELVLGSGCAALWLSLMRYLDVSPFFYSTILTLQASLPKIGRFLIGVIPLFVSFTIFAIVVFGSHAARYADPSIAFFSLFAFFNGDALREAYTHTEGRSSPPSAVAARAAAYGAGKTDYWWGGVSRGDWGYGFSFYTIVGDLHLVLITLVFMYVVINCCVAVVEEAFFDTRSADGAAQLEAIKEKGMALRRRVMALAAQSTA